MKEKEIQTLIQKVIDVRKNAYAPYSKFLVGSIVIDEVGREYSGVNVENTSYGLSSCAERNAIFSAVASGIRSLRCWRLGRAYQSMWGMSPGDFGICNGRYENYLVQFTREVQNSFYGRIIA